MSLVRRIARTSLAAIFVVQGVDALRHPAPLARRATPLLAKLVSTTGLPDDPELLVRANAVTQIAGGALLATGVLPRLGGTMIAASLVPTTLAGHPFWKAEDAEQRKVQRINFLKNLGLFGGVLLAMLDTAGQPGLAWRAQHIGKVSKREARHALKSTGREAKIARQSAKLKVQGALG